METSFIKKHWENQADKYGDSHWASWGDQFMIELETDLVSREISSNDSVLDAGCANGYTAFRQLELHPDIFITGIDFTEGMIREANRRKKQIAGSERAVFIQADIRNTGFDDRQFDMAYTTRVLINLPSWSHQKEGILELLRIVKPGGKVVLLEGFWEPLMKLNALREIMRLPSLKEHDFNRYLKMSLLEDFLNEQEISYRHIDFSSVYYLGSRFLRELITSHDDLSAYTNPLNEFFYRLEREFSGGGFGIQQAYILHV